MQKVSGFGARRASLGDRRICVNEARGIGEMGVFVLLVFEMDSYVGD